jgi:1-deoxy-D-xylulose-5-phosphate synthase
LGINPEIVNMRFIKPLDTELLDEIASRHKKIVTLEENSIVGGFGSGVAEYFIDKNYKTDILRIGLPDYFIDHGTQSELHSILGIDSEGIVKQVSQFCKSNHYSNEVSV